MSQAQRRLPSSNTCGKTKRKTAETITLGLELRNSQLEILEHSALVALICSSIAEMLDVPEGEAYILESAASLHELGMFTIPPDLLLRSSSLSPEELGIVRSQARVSAEIASAMHHPRIVALIANQYENFSSLRHLLSEQDLLLAGILRVSDTIAATGRPRPYQDRLSEAALAEALESGAGTTFHPLVVRCPQQFCGAEVELISAI